MPPSVDGGEGDRQRREHCNQVALARTPERGESECNRYHYDTIDRGVHGECVDSRSRRRCLEAAESLGQGARAVAAGRDPRCPGEGWYEESRCHPPLVRPMVEATSPSVALGQRGPHPPRPGRAVSVFVLDASVVLKWFV